jgi:hypothetical protein
MKRFPAGCRINGSSAKRCPMHALKSVLIREINRGVFSRAEVLISPESSCLLIEYTQV